MTILLVDDNADVLELVSEYLLARFECQVLRASSYEVAVSLLWGNEIDLVISDYDLPKGTGLDLFVHVPKEVGFILFTGNVGMLGRRVEVSGREVRVVGKPNLEQLVRQVVGLLESQ